MAFFDIVLQTETSLHPHGEPSDYVATYTGVVRCTRGRDERLTRVGRVKAHRIHAESALQNGVSPFDICDAHSQEMHDIHAALYDSAEEDLKPEVREQFDGFDLDVLVLDYVLLHPRWRGLKLGLLAARKMIDLLGTGCALVVADIAPLHPEAPDFAGVPPHWLPYQKGDALKTARAKLRRYFRRMGFERITGSRLHGLSLARLTPNLAELLRPGT